MLSRKQAAAITACAARQENRPEHLSFKSMAGQGRLYRSGKLCGLGQPSDRQVALGVLPMAARDRRLPFSPHVRQAERNSSS